MSGRVVHFEVPFSDGKRARNFYQQAFGWQLAEIPEMKYTTVATGPVADSGMPAEPGYIGGEAVGEKTPVGEMGFAAYFKDTEGNVMGLWESAS